ncbi:MAG TPA: PAS domain S-box protein [Acidimicrobiales bacterium]|nr:PAS domain S-box protein [Acidimicrobiales bacterium]
MIEALIDAVPDAIITADASGRIVSWNPAAERIFGYSAVEVVGQSLTVLIPERFQAAHSEGLARVAAGGDPRVIGTTVELVGVRRGGAEFPIELSLSTWTVEGARYFGGIIRDTTERTRLTAELAESEARMAAILRSATDAIVAADQLGQITLWNDAAEQMLGYRADEVVGRPLTVIIPERFHDAHNAGILRMTRGEEPKIIGSTVEVFALRKDGSEVPIELSLATWELGGDRFYSGILRDISMRRWAEERIEAANTELAEKNQQLEALSAKLAKYLSRQVYDSIFAGRTEVRVQSYRKLLTVFFSDIKGFTDLTDMMEAEALSDLLNEYLSEMSAIASAHGGTIDKFIGDGIMIFFGDPESHGSSEDAVACARMALAMRERVTTLREEWHLRGVQRPLHVRMGINTGYCTVGNFGSDERLDYTIVGGQVNVASRLEANAEDDQILISHQTWALVRDAMVCEPVGEIKVKGIAHPLLTYEILGAAPETEDDETGTSTEEPIGA